MSIISRNHIEFMKQFIDDTNTLTAKLLKDHKASMVFQWSNPML